MRVPQRGRAILRRLSAHEPVRAFRPGDFLLTAHDGGLARLTGWATGDELNHAALIIDPLGTVVEATPALFADARAVRLATVGDYLAAGKPCWIGYVELREGSRQEVVGYTEHLLRARMTCSVAGRAWLALHTILGVAPRSLAARVPWLGWLGAFFDRHAVILREEHCFASAELVARALERGGFIWDRDPAYVTPADLFARSHRIDDLPAPVPLEQHRQAIRRGAPRAPSAPRRGAGNGAGQGAITPFIPRGTRGAARGTRGATALSEQPEHAEAPQAGLRALAQLGVFVAAGLALVGVLEEALKLLVREG